MRALNSSISLLFLSLSLCGQVSRQVISYDFTFGVHDTIVGVPYDSTLAEDFTTGDNRGNAIASLPVQPVFPLASNPNYSERFPAADSFTTSDYPFSSSVALRIAMDDSISNNCSGSLVSHNLVLTAYHCFSYFINDTATPDFYVYPAFDRGRANALFDSVRVSKIFYFEGSDLAFALLDKPIGYNTGWIGFGYAQNSILSNKLFHKISYPAFDLFGTKDFNGDTMFYENGYLNDLSGSYLGVTNVVGIGGQSGSSWFTSQNFPITYGTLYTAGNFRHQRITPEEFYSMTNIQKDLSNPEKSFVKLDVYPNPANDQLSVITPPSLKIKEISLFSTSGVKANITYCKVDSHIFIDLTDLTEGLYLLNLESEQEQFIYKIMIVH